MKNILQRIGATSIRSTSGKVLAIVGLLVGAQVFAAVPKSGVEKQYADYLVEAIQMWSQEPEIIKLKVPADKHGKFFPKQSKSGGMSLASVDDDSSSDGKSDDHSSSDNKSDDC